MEIIYFQGKRRPATHLGDGVYAIFDGFGIWLHANSHDDPTDKVYLEPNVLNSLARFDEEVRSEGAIDLIRQLNET